jgi:hypothetical protein
MRRLLTVAVFGVSLLTATPAHGANFFVTGTADTVGTPCTPGDAGLLNCASLREAVNEANANADAQDVIILSAGTYTLTSGELVLGGGIGIAGVSARSTIISGNHASRVIRVPFGAQTVALAGLTLTAGSVTSANGANVLNQGELIMSQVAVTGGNAGNGSGGGIANVGGQLSIIQSLVANNTATFSGGGIDNSSLDAPGTVQVNDSTFSGNSGSTGNAIGTAGSGSSVFLDHVTLVNDQPGFGLSISTSGQTVQVRASILSGNSICNSTKPADGGYNLESSTSCALTASGTSQSAVNPQLSPTLVNAGGPTDVHTFPAGSPAEGFVTFCGSAIDQRGYQRDIDVFTACDAGAYELGGIPPASEEPPPVTTPTPTPTPVAPTPTPTATTTPAGTPVAGKSVGVEPHGKVLVKVPGSKRFVPLDLDVIKNGTEVDVRQGTVDITRSDGGKATFFGGIFKLSQPGGITTLTLSEALACKSAKRSLAAAKKPKVRRLWGDGKGKFRTSGKYAAATVRGTKWLIQDACKSTTTRVVTGVVQVRDQVKKKNVTLRKGKSYTARARK